VSPKPQRQPRPGSASGASVATSASNAQPRSISALCTSTDLARSKGVSRRKVPDIYYIDDPKNSSLPRIKMNSSVAEKSMIDRLAHPQTWITRRRNVEEMMAVMKEADEGPLSPRSFVPKKFTSAELEDSIDRLYTRGMKSMVDSRMKVQLKWNQVEAERKVLSQEEMEESAERLYTEDLERRKASKAATYAKYYPDEDESRTLTTDEMEEMARRCCNEAAEHKIQSMASLELKYAYLPKKGKTLDAEAVKLMGERLSKAPKRAPD